MPRRIFGPYGGPPRSDKMANMPRIRRDFLSCCAVFSIALLVLPGASRAAAARDAADIVRAAIEYWRDASSYSVSGMVIHRPDWERRVTLRVWTRGEKHSLVRVTSPPRDAGNATLLVDNEMWSFTPKINRVVKIPSSMMNQSWMGSDFSNNDLAKADDLIEHYTHRLLRTEQRAGREVWVIESVPKEDAPVVWGREVVTVRDDYVLLAHDFYDQQGVLVKQLSTLELKPMGGKTVAARQRMQRVDKPGEWTEIRVSEAKFGLDVPDSFFTLSHLRNPRE
jgi:outer membrane lipoprotein-sorting protein